jgi:hypothetical protein
MTDRIMSSGIIIHYPEPNNSVTIVVGFLRPNQELAEYLWRDDKPVSIFKHTKANMFVMALTEPNIDFLTVSTTLSARTRKIAYNFIGVQDKEKLIGFFTEFWLLLGVWTMSNFNEQMTGKVLKSPEIISDYYNKCVKIRQMSRNQDLVTQFALVFKNMNNQNCFHNHRTRKYFSSLLGYVFWRVEYDTGLDITIEIALACFQALLPYTSDHGFGINSGIEDFIVFDTATGLINLLMDCQTTPPGLDSSLHEYLIALLQVNTFESVSYNCDIEHEELYSLIVKMVSA